MPYTPNIKKIDGKEQILCEWRHKFVRLTPEEWVRQYFLHYMVDDLGYPQARIAVEHPIQVGEVQKRCDAVVMGDRLEPLCILEFKAEDVALSQRVFDQVAVYNRKLNVNYFILSNGKHTYACKVTPVGYEFLDRIPQYSALTNTI
ncbi:MAG: type I restriction enzyme HsdR N-terminal domain-containing protein [Paludibacteraceae bacterium]|nr:type I restriction enzyme HsdR N-terminal domain-containing protein [Paludibacteraceae bacterium]